MASYLASIFGTEQDKVNCSFYYKIGACRHGDRCSRKHVKPSYSQTILCPNLYQNPAFDPKNKMNPQQLQNHFDAFYEDFFCEMCKYGEVEEVVVCDNNNDHLIGNVYARFKFEEDAQAACDDLNSRWYAARPIYCELSPVTDFREACCRLNSGEGCVRAGFCNFIHRKEPDKNLERELELGQKKYLRMIGKGKKSPSRSPTPPGGLRMSSKERAEIKTARERSREGKREKSKEMGDRRERERDEKRERDRDDRRERDREDRGRTRSRDKRDRRVDEMEGVEEAVRVSKKSRSERD